MHLALNSKNRASSESPDGMQLGSGDRLSLFSTAKETEQLKV